MPQIPVLFVGRAVEEAFCRMLQESPALLIGTASSNTLSNIPLDDDGVPSRESEGPCPADRLLALPVDMWPSDFEGLRNWAQDRLKVHLPLALQAMKEEWQKDEKRELIDRLLKQVENKQMKNITKWIEEHPDYMEDETLQQEYIDLIRKCTSNVEDCRDKVLKRVCDNIYITDK